MNYQPGYNNYQNNAPYGSAYGPQYGAPYGGNGSNFNMPYNQKQNEKRRLATISKVCGGAVMAFALIGLFAGLILSHISSFMTLYNSNPIFKSALTTVLYCVTVLVPFYIAYTSLRNKDFVGELPLTEPNSKKDFLFLIPAGLMICLVGSYASSLLATAVDAWFGIQFNLPDDTSDYTTVTGVLLSLLQTAFLPAFIEEFAIRGVVMQSLRKYGDGFAIIMSSVVFALMHGNMIQIPFAFIAGIAMGYVVIRTGSLWTSVIIHFLNNTLAVVSLVIEAHTTQNAASIIIGIIYGIVLLIGLICTVFYVKRNKEIFACLQRGQLFALSTGEKVSQFIFTVPMIIAIGFLVYETSAYIS